MALAPLLAYGLAALVHLAARAFGARGGFLAARAALFWSALAGGAGGARRWRWSGSRPRRLDRAAVAWLGWLGYAGLAFWLWLFAASLAEAEGFAATGRVAAVVAAAFAGIGGLLALAAGGTVGVGAAAQMWGQLVIDSLVRPRAAARQVLARGAAGGAAAARRRCSSPASAWCSATSRCG